VVKRQTAVYFFKEGYYGVKYRQRNFLFFWGRWRDVVDGGKTPHNQYIVAWPKASAYLRSDLAMKNGVIFSGDHNVLPVWDRDEESEEP
jgi:hypothetical protein